ncbi:uncharacterized transmembrane protein DDB_G0289901-like [Palaemon carinicauda]|uniref:uncharacterized transmembrane protein DDB_G0289901-like n=1 Tax=Palaemon carinicauda TaxID=392227 RepID=UPI0035B66DFA
MPEGVGSNDCHLCHIHDHAPASTLLRTHPLRASQSRSRNPSKSSTTTLNRNLHNHHHHHHDGGHHSRENGTIREADAKSLRVASALAKLSERSHSLPGSRGSSISRPNEVSILPNGSPPEHSHRGNEIPSISRSQREYNNVLAALLETRAGSLPSSHSASHREPDLLNALPRTHNTSRASTISRGQLHHSNLTLAQDTEQDYYTHINRSRFKDEARKQRFNLQTVMLIGCYTMLFVVAIIVGVVLCQQNGWLGFGHGSSDEVSGNISNDPNDLNGGTSSMRDLDRSTRGRGNRGNWPGPTIDYDYPSDGQPPRINSAGIFPGGPGRGTNIQNTPSSKDDPLRTVNFQPTGSFDGSNGNRRRPVQRVPSPVGGGDTRTRFDQDDSLGVGNGGNQQLNTGNSLGSGKSILDSLDESASNGFGGNEQNNRNQNTPRGQSRNNNPFTNFASPGRAGIVNPDAPGRPVLQNFPSNPQRESNQNRAGINNNGASNPNINRNRGSNLNSNGVNNRNVNGGRGNGGGSIQGENLGNNEGFLDRPGGNFASSNGNQRNQPNRDTDNRAGSSRNSQNSNFNTGSDFGETNNPNINFSPSGQDSAINDGSNFNGNSNNQGGGNFDDSLGSNGRGTFDDGADSNGRGTFNDGTNSNGRGTFNDGTSSNGRGTFNGDTSSNGRGSFNDGSNSNGRRTFNGDTSSNGRGSFNDGSNSNGRGTFNDGTSSNGRGTFNDGMSSIGRGSFEDGTSSNGGDNINDSFNSNGRRNFNSGPSTVGRGNFDVATGTGGSNFDTGPRGGGGNFDSGANSGGIGNFDGSLGGTSNFGINGGSLEANTNTGTGTSGAGDFQIGSGTRGTKNTNGGGSSGLGNLNSGSGIRGANFDNAGGFEGSGNMGPTGNGPVRAFDNFQPGGMGDVSSGLNSRGSNGFNNAGTSDVMGNLNSGSGSQVNNFNNGGGSSNFGNFNSGNGMVGVSNKNSPTDSRGMPELTNGDSSGGRGSSSNFAVNGASGGRDNFSAGSGIEGSRGGNTGTSGNFNLGFGGSGPSNINSNLGTNMESGSTSGGRNNFNLNEATMNQGSSNMKNGANMNQEPFGISSGNFNGGSSGSGNRGSGLGTIGSQSTSNGDFSLGTVGNANMGFGIGLNNNGQSLGGSPSGSNNNFDIASSIISDGRLPTPIPGMFPQQMRDLGNGDRRRMPSGRNLNLQNHPDNDKSDSILNSQRGETNSSPVTQGVEHRQNGAQTKSSQLPNTGNIDPLKNMGETAMPTSPHLNAKPVGHNWEGQKGKTNQNANRNSGSHVMGGVSLPSSGTMSSGSQQPTNTFGSGDGNSGQPTPEIPVTTHQGIITIPPSSGSSTPLKVLKGFTVQRGEVVAISTIKSSDKDISILQPDHDVVFHITPNAPDAGISLIRHPHQDPNMMSDLAATSTTAPPRGGASAVLRRWEHTDNEGTLSRGLVRKDGSFAFTNCRPSEVCDKNLGSSGS